MYLKYINNSKYINKFSHTKNVMAKNFTLKTKYDTIKNTAQHIDITETILCNENFALINARINDIKTMNINIIANAL